MFLFRTACILLIIGLMSISISTHTISLADSVNPGIFSKDSGPYGAPYGEWITEVVELDFFYPQRRTSTG